MESAANARKSRTTQEWSIGIYSGPSVFELTAAAENPVLTSWEARDVDADFVADPFMVRHRGSWLLFHEVLRKGERRGVLSLATSRDGIVWSYQGVVLEEPFHLSYPQVFAWQGSFYMIPETLGCEAVRLYRADSFPSGWVHVADLLEGRWTDPAILRHSGLWWLFAGSDPKRNTTLELFYAEDLPGPWHRHPASPLVADDHRMARAAGRMIHLGGRPFRFAQDCEPIYGARVRAFEITELTPSGYREREHPASPILEPTGRGWNADCMHHVDAHRLADGSWLACVDGYRKPDRPPRKS